MGAIPDRPNFYGSLDTCLTKAQIADLYLALGWEVRMCSWEDYEVESDWAELVIEAESPILMHGAVADIPFRAQELVAPLRAAGISFSAEFYGPEPIRDLLLELRS